MESYTEKIARRNKVIAEKKHTVEVTAVVAVSYEGEIKIPGEVFKVTEKEYTEIKKDGMAISVADKKKAEEVRVKEIKKPSSKKSKGIKK